MEKANKNLAKCEEMTLDFFKNIKSAKSLEIIVDIYNEIRYSEVNKKAEKQKFLRILYNLTNSSNLDSLLEEEDRIVLNLFLKDFLEIRHDEGKFYIENQYFAELTLDEFYRVLIEVKYLKQKKIINQKQLSV